MRLVPGQVLRREVVAEMLARGGLRRVLAFLEEYLARQVEIGRPRPHNVRSSARALMGMFVPQAVGKPFLPLIAAGGPSDEEIVQTAISLFLRGLRPDSEE